MSTPTSSTAPLRPSLDTAGNPSDSSGGMQRGASYFFGFLITFIVLLLAFVGCGVLSRRRFAARRRERFEWNMEPWMERMAGGEVGYVPPVLMEKGWTKAEDGLLWKEMAPLAATIVSPKSECRQLSSDRVSRSIRNPHSPQMPPTGLHSRRSLDTNVAPALSPSPRRNSEVLARIGPPESDLTHATDGIPYNRNSAVILQRGGAQETHRQQDQESRPESNRHGFFQYLRLPSWLRSLDRRSDRGQREDAIERGTRGPVYNEKGGTKTREPQDKTIVQVVLMIQMPSSHAHPPREGRIPEYEIGVAQISLQDDPLEFVPHKGVYSGNS